MLLYSDTDAAYWSILNLKECRRLECLKLRVNFSTRRECADVPFHDMTSVLCSILRHVPPKIKKLSFQIRPSSGFLAVPDQQAFDVDLGRIGNALSRLNELEIVAFDIEDMDNVDQKEAFLIGSLPRLYKEGILRFTVCLLLAVSYILGLLINKIARMYVMSIRRLLSTTVPVFSTRIDARFLSKGNILG